MVRFQRVGGRQPPPDRENLDVEEDGTFRMWRSNWSTVIGRFGGALDPAARSAVAAVVSAAASAEPVSETPYPDAAVDVVAVDSREAAAGQHQQLPGPWGELLTKLRSLLGDLTAFPVAAVAVEVAPDGSTARLVHRGNEPLDVDLSSGSVSVVQWDRENNMLGRWAAPIGGTRASAGPGWVAELPFGHGLAPAAGSVLHTYVVFAAYDGTLPVDVQIVDAPAAG